MNRQLTPEQEAQNRRNAKRKRRPVTNIDGRAVPKNGLGSIANRVRKQAILLRSREDQRRMWVAVSAAKLLTNRAKKEQWEPWVTQASIELINAYAGIAEDSQYTIDMSAGLSQFQEHVVRQYFATAMVRAHVKPANTPGQLAYWYFRYLHRTKRSHLKYKKRFPQV